jgi:hypothetical protein
MRVHWTDADAVGGCGCTGRMRMHWAGRLGGCSGRMRMHWADADADALGDIWETQKKLNGWMEISVSGPRQATEANRHGRRYAQHAETH